jgi:SAM-dependent methyltransferase
MTSIDPLLLEHTRRIRQNAFLYLIYQDVYNRISAELPCDAYPRVLEIGSGGGFLKSWLPHLVTSDCVAGPGIDQVVDACNLTASFGPSSLDAITAYNVFHHLPNAEGFLRGAESVLRPGGRIVLVEPWFTPVGQWFYRAIHHEPVILDSNDWTISGEGRLDGANSRLPTSVFLDGRARLLQVAPELRVERCQPFHKWLYLASGGLRLNTRIPNALARLLLRLDRATTRFDHILGIFALIVVQKR